jgi:ABC-2 type transport system ATP-binding protein
MIEVSNLRKLFGSKLAVDDISFQVGKGQVLGFLGPNGAGKSTTMRMITGFFPPTKGSVTVCGVNMLENPVAAKKHIGYLPENAPLYADMTVSGFLGFAAELRGLRGTARKAAVDRAIELCFLERVRKQSVDTLSKGYKHRTCLAQSLIHDPDVLILDEPTDGLDPNQKHEVRNLIKRMAQDKVIIFSTHILEEVEAVCSRAIVIDRGSIVADGTPDELRSRAPSAGVIHAHLKGLAGSGILQELEKISGVEKVEAVTTGDNFLSARVFPTHRNKAREVVDAIDGLARERKLHIEEIGVEQGRLDEVFRAITLADTAA